MASNSFAPAVTWPPWPSGREVNCSGSVSWRLYTLECVTPSPSPTVAPQPELTSGPISASTCPTARLVNTPSKKSSPRATCAEIFSYRDLITFAALLFSPSSFFFFTELDSFLLVSMSPCVITLKRVPCQTPPPHTHIFL